MGKIILFDIDGTLFNRDDFLGNFDYFLHNDLRLSDSELEDIVNIYDEIKNDFGYFSYHTYLERIYKLIPSLNKKLDYYFAQENISKYLFPDSQALFSIKDVRMGTFSKGDVEFQKMKVTKLLGILEEDFIYIFHNKIEKLPEVINANSDSKIFLVDDKIDVLVSAKDVNPNVTTILMDRKESLEKVNGIDFKLNSLFDIIAILS